MNLIENTKKYFIKNSKLLLFLVIFILFCIICNQNNQNLNYFLKRGVILEYSFSKNLNIDKEKIKNELLNLGFNYSFVDELNKTEINEYDWDNKKIEKILFIALPTLPTEDKKEVLNKVSDYVFENYQNSKLISVKALNNEYNKPFSTFLKFLGLLFVSFVFWLILIYLFCDKKILAENIKNSTKNFFIKTKEDFITLIKKTKENGIGYFIKRILFDDNDNSETNITKEIISTIVFVLLCVIAIRYFIGELRWIPSGSMRPTILEKDRVFVEKLKYPKKEIKRGDILVFYPPEIELSNSPFAILSRLSGIFCKDIAFIKRVVGLPNEKLEIKFDQNNNEYRVYINDKALVEPYIISRSNWTPCVDKMYCGPFIVPKGHYFMMGDNRGNSQDSRFWGFLDQNRIIGRANFMFFPIQRINSLKDKYLILHKQKTKDGYVEYNYIIDRYEFLYKI